MSNMCKVLVGTASCLLISRSAPAASHQWRFNEIFTNADGTVQFIEMKECCGFTDEFFLEDKWLRGDVSTHQYTFPSSLDTGSNTALKYVLIATQDFADLPGAPTPDYIMPDGFLTVTGDTLRYWFYAPAVMTYTTGQLPTDGVTSLRVNGSTGVNSPTNYAGDSGSINVGCDDGDGDGYGSPGSAACPNGSAEDCDDTMPAINPGATEHCSDQVDNDCAAQTDCLDTGCDSNPQCPAVTGWGALGMAGLILTAAGVVLRRMKPASRVN